MTTLSIHLAGPIVGGHDPELSAAFTNHINVVHEIVNPGIVDPEFFDSGLTAREIYASASEALLSSDAVVAEVSDPSHGVGMELGAAHASGIPSLCLFDPSRSHGVSAMITGCPGLRVQPYDDWAMAFDLIDSFLLDVSDTC